MIFPVDRSRLLPITLAQIIGLVCGVAGVRLNSHLIPPGTLGFYGVFLTFVPLGMWVVHAGLLKFVVRHWAGSTDQGSLAREILAAWARRLPWLALLVIGAVATMHSFHEAGSIMIGLCLFISAALASLAALAQRALQAERSHWRDCAVVASTALTRSFGPPLLYAATGGAAIALLFAYSLHGILVMLVAAWVLHRVLAPRPNAAVTRTLTNVYEGPLFTTLAISAWLLSGLNRWVVAWFFGKAEAGYYTLAGGAAVIVTSMLGTIIMQYVQPGLFALGDGLEDNRSLIVRQADRAALTYAVLAFVLLVAFDAFAPLLVGPLISSVYQDSLVWILPAGCFGITTIIGAFYHTMLLAGRRELACGPVDLSLALVLVVGSVTAAWIGPVWLARWLLVTPLLPLCLTRPLARHHMFRPAANPGHAPDR